MRSTAAWYSQKGAASYMQLHARGQGICRFVTLRTCMQPCILPLHDHILTNLANQLPRSTADRDMESRHGLHASCEREGDGVQAHYTAAPLHSPASLCCLTSSRQHTVAS